MLLALGSMRVSRAVGENLQTDLTPYEQLGVQPSQVMVSLDVPNLLSKLIVHSQEAVDRQKGKDMWRTLGGLGTSLLLMIVGVVVLTRQQSLSPEVEKGVLALLGAVTGFWLKG